MMAFKGRLLLARSMLKLFFGRKFLRTKEIGLKMSVLEENGGVNVTY